MKKATTTLAAAALLATAAATEDRHAARLAQARAGFEKAAAAALVPELRAHLESLAALERELVLERDYTAAAAVQAERLKVREKLGRADRPEPKQRKKITFRTADATVAENTLTWIPKEPVPPGGYRVTTTPPGVEATVSEGFHTAPVGATLRVATGATITVTLAPGEGGIEKLTLAPGA